MQHLLSQKNVGEVTKTVQLLLSQKNLGLGKSNKDTLWSTKTTTDFRRQDKERNIHCGYGMSTGTKQTVKKERKDQEISTPMFQTTREAARVQGEGFDGDGGGRTLRLWNEKSDKKTF